MTIERHHYMLRNSPWSIQTLLLVLLVSQATSLSIGSAQGRRLSGRSNIGANQITSFCKVYSTALACTSCIRNYFLQNGTCVLVPQANLISGCNVYASNNTCAVCDNGHFLAANNTLCQSANGTSNCLSYLNQTACLSCPAGHALANFTCTAIPNCSQSNGTVCTLCMSGFYLNSTNVCQQLANFTAIANCVSYTSKGSCGRCALGYALDLNGLSCLSAAFLDNQTDPLCIDQRVQDGSICSVCRQGYSLVNGQCVFQQNSEICLLFDPAQSSTCLVCMSGYSKLGLNANCTANIVRNPGLVDPVGKYSSINAIASVLLVFISLKLA